MKNEEHSISFNAAASSLPSVGLQTPPLPTLEEQNRPLRNGEREGKQKAASDRVSGLVKQREPLNEGPGKQKPPLDRSSVAKKQRYPLSKTSDPVRQKGKSQVHRKAPSGAKMVKDKPPLDESTPQKAASDKDAAPPRVPQEPDPTDLVHTNSQDSILKRQNVAEWLFKTQNYAKHNGTSAHMVQRDEQSNKLSAKRTVYLSDSSVQFPETLVGAQAMVKVRLCNRDTVSHSFAVIKPSQPFSVMHVNFDIG